MLESDQIIMVATDLLNGKEPRVEGQEADDLREQLKKEIKLAEENGWIVDIPAEWEDIDDEGHEDEKYTPGQPRDSQGRFAGGGGGVSSPDMGGSYGGGTQESEIPPIQIYHGTTKEVVDSILKNGIEARLPGEGRYGIDVSSQPKGVYCGDDLRTAINWGGAALEQMSYLAGIPRSEMTGEFAIIEAEVPRTSIKTDPVVTTAYYVNRDVSVSEIKAVHFVTGGSLQRHPVVGGALKQDTMTIYVPIVTDQGEPNE